MIKQIIFSTAMCSFPKEKYCTLGEDIRTEGHYTHKKKLWLCTCKVIYNLLQLAIYFVESGHTYNILRVPQINNSCFNSL